MDKEYEVVIKKNTNECREGRMRLALAAGAVLAAALIACIVIIAFNKPAAEKEIIVSAPSEPFGSSAQRPQGLPSYNVTEQHALRIAESFCKQEMFAAGRSGGKLPCYEFEAEGVKVSVTVMGGAVKSFEKQSEYKDTVRSDFELESAAEGFLWSRGFGKTSAAYIERKEGRACVYMLPVHESDALLYTDLLRVYINMETLGITGFRADDYILNHRFRDIDARLSPADALKSIPSSYVVERPVLTVISAGGGEKLCYRCKCAKDGFGIIIFVNAQSGQIEEICSAV